MANEARSPEITHESTRTIRRISVSDEGNEVSQVCRCIG